MFNESREIALGPRGGNTSKSIRVWDCQKECVVEEPLFPEVDIQKGHL